VLHSVKVSLLIVQVPVQTERLNPRGTNPARKSLSLCAVPRMYTRVYAHIRVTHIPLSASARVRVHGRTLTRDSGAILYSNAGQEAPASLSFLNSAHPPGTVASLPAVLHLLCPCVRSHSLSLSLSLSRGLEKETCATKIIKSASFRSVPFRLYISHLALSLALSIFHPRYTQSLP